MYQWPKVEEHTKRQIEAMLKAMYGGFGNEYFIQTNNHTYAICDQYFSLKRFSKLGMTCDADSFDPYTRNLLAFIANVCAGLENKKAD